MSSEGGRDACWDRTLSLPLTGDDHHTMAESASHRTRSRAYASACLRRPSKPCCLSSPMRAAFSMMARTSRGSPRSPISPIRTDGRCLRPATQSSAPAPPAPPERTRAHTCARIAPTAFAPLWCAHCHAASPARHGLAAAGARTPNGAGGVLSDKGRTRHTTTLDPSESAAATWPGCPQVAGGSALPGAFRGSAPVAASRFGSVSA